MGDIFTQIASVEEIAVADAAELNAWMRDARAPFVVRGLVADWPLVKAARRSGREARTYLLQRARDVPYPVAVGDPASGGRMFYDEAMRLNFRSAEAKLRDIFARIDAVEGDATAPPLYLSSIDVRNFFPGLHEANHVPLDAADYLASIWIGTHTRVAAHNDTPNNLACVAAGKRRFTVFPRDQYANLYLGPVDNTPGGRAVSMVDFHAPDFERFPRFREALSQARTVELDAGDAIYMPGMWWHHVEGLAPFNILVNYWWRTTPAYLGNPQDALNHAMMSIRDLPDDEKAHWRDLFDFYVFGGAAAAASHIPADARGVLAPLTAETAGRIRGFLLRQLSR